jgi:hypothetical protein
MAQRHARGTFWLSSGSDASRPDMHILVKSALNCVIFLNRFEVALICVICDRKALAIPVWPVLAIFPSVIWPSYAPLIIFPAYLLAR